MSFPLALELKNCLARHPDDELSQILARVKFAAFMRTGAEPTKSELKQAIEFFLKYSPDQPRVPAGSPGGGQWTSGGGGTDGGDFGLGGIASALLETCESLLEKDLSICRALQSRACYAQAMERYSACLVGKPIPFFPFFRN